VTAQDDEHFSRDERRRRSEAAIFDAASAEFAEMGFERTTIRSVAAAASVDPALVMQYFGSKERLFATVARQTRRHSRVLQAALADVPTAVLEDMFEDFEDPEGRAAAIALVRSCLTHDSAADVLRDDVMCEVHDAVAARIGGDEAELRASLLGATMVGLAIARYLLAMEPLAGASREDVERIMRPALRAIVAPDA